MTVVFHRLDTDALAFTQIGHVTSGEVRTDDAGLEQTLTPLDLSDEPALIDHFDGPTLFASPLAAQPTAKADTDSEGEWVPYEGPQGGEGWQHIDTGEVRYTDNPPGPVADDDALDLPGSDDTTLEPVSVADLDPGDEVVVEWDGDRDRYTLDAIQDAPGEGSDLFQFHTSDGTAVSWKRYQLTDESGYTPEVVGRVTPAAPGTATDTFEVGGTLVEAVAPDDVQVGDELVAELDDRGETAVMVENIQWDVETAYNDGVLVHVSDPDGKFYRLAAKRIEDGDQTTVEWTDEVVGRVVPTKDQTFEDNGYEIKPIDFDEIEIEDELLVTLDGEKTTGVVRDQKGTGKFKRLFIETAEGWEGTITPHSLRESPDYELHGEVMGVAGDDAATDYIQGVPVSDPPAFDELAVDDRLFLETEAGEIREGRIVDMPAEDRANIILETGSEFYISADDYPDEMTDYLSDGYPEYEAVAERLPGDELRTFEVDGYTLDEVKPDMPSATLDAGDTIYWEGKDGENRRAYYLGAGTARSGQPTVTAMTTDGSQFTFSSSSVYGDITIGNIHGVITDDGRLPQPDSEQVIEWGRDRFAEIDTGDFVEDVAANYIADMFRLGATADVIEEGIEVGVEASDAVESTPTDRFWENIYRDGVNDAMEQIAETHVEGWDHSYNLGSVRENSDLRDEFLAEWKEAADDDEERTVRKSLAAWSSLTTQMSDQSAPLWRAAWREHTNEFVASNEQQIREADVSPDELDAWDDYRDHVIDVFVDALGPDDGVPDPDDVAPDEVEEGDRVAFSTSRVAGEGRIVWSDGDYFDVRGPNGEIHELIPDDILDVVDTRGRVTIPVFKGVKGSSSRVAKLGEQIRNGETVELRQMTLDSWATNPDSAWQFARGNGFVVRKELPVTDIWAAGITTKSLLDSENEIIFGHDAEYMQLRDADVQFTDQKTPVEDVEWAVEHYRDRDLLKADDRPRLSDVEVASTYDFTDRSWNWLKRVALQRKYRDDDPTLAGVDLFAPDDTNDASDTERRKGYVSVGDLQGAGGFRDTTLAKAGANVEQVDDLLMAAIEKQVWREIDEIEKAPNMWRRDDNVPQFVRSFVQQAALDKDVLYNDFANVPHMAALKVHSIIHDELTDSHGWSIKSIRDELAAEFEGIDTDHAEIIARTEVAAVLNTARKQAYEQAAENPDVYWSGPDDSRTTDLCTDVKAEIDAQGGYIKLDALRDLLAEKAREYRDDGGTPRRVDEFVPHFQCRHTFIRKEYRFLD